MELGNGAKTMLLPYLMHAPPWFSSIFTLNRMSGNRSPYGTAASWNRVMLSIASATAPSAVLVASAVPLSSTSSLPIFSCSSRRTCAAKLSP